jgi:ParB-like chromosome segregation protein Spo0J
MARLEWTTEKRLVKDLIPLDYNPRTRNERKQKKLSGSLAKFNLVEIPVVNLDNRIIAGQRRWEALHEAGRGNEPVDVRVPNRMLTGEEVREYNLDKDLFDKATKGHDTLSNTILDTRMERKHVNDKIEENFGL